MSQTQEKIPICSAEAGCSVLKEDRYKVPVPVSYPNLTILIHGVNDVGSAYQAQDEGLCKGLNARLNRSDSLAKAGGDLLAADYNMSFASKLAELEKNGDTKTAQKLRSDPDSILYHRADVKGTWSPVIPFYWGFREEDGVNPKDKEPYIDKTQWHGEWLDRHGNRMDKNGSKGGGPFANATTNIADFWSGGKGAFTAWMLDSDPIRPFKATPNRHYFVLAALRLASLIEMIRTKPETERAAINVMGHSQGCLITLLAQAILAERGSKPADCLILQHPPYSLEETFVEGTFDRGSHQQTVQARLDTLVNIVGFVTGQPQTSPALAELLDPAIGRAVVGKHWRPGPGAQRCVAGAGVSFAERDNRGKVYLYFSHHDQTVSLLNVQGVGWQGVPDQVAAITGYSDGRDGPKLPTWSTLPAMNALKSKRFFQRVFTEIKRDGEPERVGLRTNYHYVLREKGEASPTGRGLFNPSASVPKKEQRFINSEPLNPPCTPSLGAANIPIDYVDASIALTSGRIKALTRTDTLPDPRPPERRGKPLGSDEREDLLAQAQADYDRRAEATGKDYATANRCRVEKVELAPDGQLTVHRTETPNEMKERLLKERTDTNSFHSGIPANPEHHEKVSAYDLALGAPVPPDLEVNGWLPYLRAVADWRTGWQKMGEDIDANPDPILQRLLDWLGKEPSPDAKALIDATERYYSTGELPPQVAALTSVSLLISQTTAERYSGTPPHPFKAPA